MRYAVLVLVACGSSQPPPPPPPRPAPAPVAPVQHVESEQQKHDEIAAAHRKIEEEQQDALAATCEEPANHEPHERCLPSCYATEVADVRAGKQLAGTTELQHLACEKPGGGVILVDELGGKLAFKRAPRVPKPHKAGSWQGDVETALADAAVPKLPRGDVLIVTGGWRQLEHPVTKERMRCVAVSRFTRATHHKLDACASDGSLACEAAGDAAARGINVVHYRLAEARRLQSAGKTAECQQAALEAIAVARGMPRWRQYAKLNAHKWATHAGYRTRFDGTLDEDALFAAAASLGGDAEQVYAACGGAAAQTTAAQEQSFHTCW